MRILLQVHSSDQCLIYNDPLVNYILREPFYSYKHSTVLSKTDFLKLLTTCLDSNHRTIVEINGFIEESDIEGLELWLKELINTSIHGFMFADLAVLMILKDLGYQGETIYAPETILTNTLEVRTLLQSVTRVLISKELTLQESLEIAQAFPNKIEMFGAGHLQLSLSRRPLLSSYLSEIGDDRDPGHQMNFTIRELKRKEKMPILEEARTFCVFSQDILNPLEELPSLTQSTLYGIHLDDLFIGFKESQDFFQLILNQVLKVNEKQIIDFYKTNSLPLFKGYFYRKTNLRQESL